MGLGQVNETEIQKNWIRTKLVANKIKTKLIIKAYLTRWKTGKVIQFSIIRLRNDYELISNLRTSDQNKPWYKSISKSIIIVGKGHHTPLF